MAGQAAPPGRRSGRRGSPAAYGGLRRRGWRPVRFQRFVRFCTESAGGRRGHVRRLRLLHARRLGRRLAPYRPAAPHRGPCPARRQRRPHLPRGPRLLAEPVLRQRPRPRLAADGSDRPGPRRHPPGRSTARPDRWGAAAASGGAAGGGGRGAGGCVGRRERRHLGRRRDSGRASGAAGGGVGGWFCGIRFVGLGSGCVRYDVPLGRCSAQPRHHVRGFSRRTVLVGSRCSTGCGAGHGPGRDAHRHRPFGCRSRDSVDTTGHGGPGCDRRRGGGPYRRVRFGLRECNPVAGRFGGSYDFRTGRPACGDGGTVGGIPCPRCRRAPSSRPAPPGGASPDRRPAPVRTRAPRSRAAAGRPSGARQPPGLRRVRRFRGTGGRDDGARTACRRAHGQPCPSRCPAE